MRKLSWTKGCALAAAIALGCLSATGCGGSEGGSNVAAAASAPAPSAAAPSAPAITEAVRKRARETFASTCASCHGPSGRGDGPGAAGLEPKPRAFSDREWQKGVTDEHIEKTIVFGGAAVGKSPNMPAHPMFKDNAPMRAALREVVRKLGE